MENSDPNIAEQEVTTDQAVPARRVALRLFGGLAIALLVTWAMGGFHLDLIVMAYWFPLGITLFWGVPDLHLSLILGYALYAAVFVCAFVFRKGRAFAFISAIYFLILLGNIGGCVAIQNIEIH